MTIPSKLREYMRLQEKTCRLLDHGMRYPYGYIDSNSTEAEHFFFCAKCNKMLQYKFFKGDFK